MQLQEQAGEADAQVTDDDRIRRDRAGRRTPLRGLAAKSDGKGDGLTYPVALVPFQFAIKLGGETPAVGSLFAESVLQAELEAQVLVDSVHTMLGHRMPGAPTASFAGYSIHIKPRPLPLAAPALFALGTKDWPSYSGELIVSGPAFFGAPSPSQAIVRPAEARTALREGRADELIQLILATDPAVRRSWLEGKEISWPLIVGYGPGMRPTARASFHVMADETALTLRTTTIAAAVCVLLASNNYTRRHGMTFHRRDMLPSMPNAASVRAALKQAHQRHDERRASEAKSAVAYLRRAGLDDLARQIEAQAMAALPAIAP